MEQTLGKRIMTHRKRLGLTQDQLAEKLGVTAQAVSKWENDISCPDISAIPLLADIFGISTDALLGREKAPAQEVTVISKETEREESHNSFEFHYDSGKRGSIGIAAVILITGGLLLTARILQFEWKLWDILWPTALLVLGIIGLTRDFSFFRIGCALFGGFFLLENLGLLPINIGTDLVLPVVLLLIGGGLLADGLKKPNKPKFEFSYDGSGQGTHRSTKNDFQIDGERFCYHAAFGEQKQFISMSRLSSGEIHTSFGDYEVDLSGIEEVTDNCRMEAHTSFGALTILVPRCYRVKPASSTAFASVDIHGHPDEEPRGTICLSANASFGEISIQYI